MLIFFIVEAAPLRELRRERWRRGSRTGRTAASSSRSRPSAARTRRVSVTFFSWCGWISVEGAAIGLAFRSGEHVWLHGGGGRAFIAQNCVSRGARTRGCTHNKDTHHTKSLCYGARLMQGHRQHTIDRSDLSHSASRERRTRIEGSRRRLSTATWRRGRGRRRTCCPAGAAAGRAT